MRQDYFSSGFECFLSLLPCYAPLRAGMITAQTRRAPLWPVVKESTCPPLPQSSTSACRTRARYSTELFALGTKEMALEVMTVWVVEMLTEPKSPACEGAGGQPWFTFSGLKCAPAAAHSELRGWSLDRVAA